MIRFAFLCSMISACAAMTKAAILYVNAVAGVNTTLADGSPFSPAPEGATGADHNWERRNNGGAGFGNGGVIYEAAGEVAAMDVDWASTLGKKSWFMFGDVIIALGSGYSYSGSYNPVETTLNQSWLSGGVTTSVAGTPLNESADPNMFVRSNCDWVWHDNIGYYFPIPTDVTLGLQTGLAGDWNVISPGLYPTPGANTATGDRFTLKINHRDLSTSSSADYIYCIVPGVSRAAFQQWVSRQNIEILSNTPALAAVRDNLNGYAGAAVFDHNTAGPVLLDDDVAVEVAENLIMLYHDFDGDPVLTLSSASGLDPNTEDFGPITIIADCMTQVLANGSPITSISQTGVRWIIDVPANVDQLVLDFPNGCGPEDLDCSGLVTGADGLVFISLVSGPGIVPVSPPCGDAHQFADRDSDDDIDLADLAAYQSRLKTQS